MGKQNSNQLEENTPTETQGEDQGIEAQPSVAEVEGDNSNVVDNSLEKSISTPTQDPSTIVRPTVTLRRDFYQTVSDCVLVLLAKNVNKSDVSVEFLSQKIVVKAKLADGQDYLLEANLYDSITPELSAFNVTPYKIEIRMRKVSAEMWPSLESVTAEKKMDKIPAPWTTKGKPKNWDKIEKEAIKETEGDIENAFAALYQYADENAQRAMMKSMQESGGTELNMNWEEVRKKTCKISPPDGMEFKRYN